MEHTCVVGLGSPHGDDRFGWVVADRLESALGTRKMAGVVVRRAGSSAQLLDWLPGLEQLYLVDACRGISPGRVRRLDWPAPEIEELRGSGSHDYTVWQTLSLASRLDILPRVCGLWCAPALQFEPNAEVSPSLLALVPGVVEDVAGTLAH